MFVHLHGKNRGLNWVHGVDHQTVSTTHCSQAHFLEVTPRAGTVCGACIPKKGAE